MKKRIDRLLPIIALSLLAIAMSMAVLFGVTYASNSSDTPIHVLNYETGRLYWAHRSDRIDENGVYQLSLFDTLPTGEDGEKIISPGDSYKNTVELRNQTGHEVTYTAVLYMVSNDNVPIISDISNIPAENDTTFYSLPDGVKSTDVVRAVEGKLGAFGIQSFEMDWKWEFSTGADGDAIDTALGNLEYSGVKMGIWIVVSDNTTAEPEPSPENTNIDIDGDGIPDVNIDTDGDGKAELNIDTDGDKVPDINVDKDKDGYPDISIDINGDGITDFNVDTDRDGIADDYIVEITIVDGVVIIPPKTFEAMMKLPEVVDSMTLKLDNFGRGIIGVDFPKQELNDFVTGGGRIHVVMTSIEVEAETSTLQSFIDASKDTNVRLIVREMLPSELTETELSNVERNRLMLALEAYAMSGTQIIRDIPSAPLKISVPFKAVEGTGKEDYKVYTVKNNGTLNPVETTFEDDKLVMDSAYLAKYVTIYEGEIDTGIEPEEHKCSCLICLFGRSNCNMCWVCWVFIVTLLLAVVAVILKLTGVLNAKR